MQGLAYGHIAYEVFDGDAPHTEYLLYSHDSGPEPITEPDGSPLIDSGATATRSSSVMVSFQQVANNPTQMRWKWGAAPSDSSNDSSGWQAYASTISVALPSEAHECQSYTLYTQLRNSIAEESIPGSARILFDNGVQAKVTTKNPHGTARISSYAHGVEGGDPSFTRETSTTLQISSSDCSGLASYRINTAESQAWPNTSGTISQTIAIDANTPGAQHTPVVIADAISNSSTFDAVAVYDPDNDGQGSPQYTAGKLQVSTENSLIRELSFSDVDVTDAIYQESTNKPFWGIWVAVNSERFNDEQINNPYSQLRWVPIPIPNPKSDFQTSISLATGQGQPGLSGMEGTYYIYVKFLDGAGNASVNTLISDPVELTQGYSLPQNFLPLMAKN